MKRVYLFLLGVLMTLPSFAQTFVYTYEGQTLYYYILDAEAKTCEVSAGNNCDGLNISGAVVIPEKAVHDGVEYTVTSIGEKAFYECGSLTEVTIPNSVTEIGKRSFYRCRGLTEVTIPNSVTSISQQAFYSCSKLNVVTMGSSVTSMGYISFGNCDNLTAVNISDLGAWAQIEFGWWKSNPLYYAHHLFLNGVEIKNLFKFRKFNLLISDCKIERYEPSLQTG